jgi:hypothetical protein
MKVLIGITKGQREAAESICKEFKGSGMRTEVGPFRSSQDASEWMRFMMARAEGYEQVTIPFKSSDDNLWYGFTFECVEPQTH